MLGEGHELGLCCEEFEGRLGELVEVDDLEGNINVLTRVRAVVCRGIDDGGCSKANGATEGVVIWVVTVGTRTGVNGQRGGSSEERLVE